MFLRKKKRSTDPTVIRLKIFGFSVLFLLFGMFKGCTDAKYLIQGESAEGIFQETKEITTSDRHRRVEGLQVKFTFTDKEGKQLVGYDRVSTSWRQPYDGKLAVRYIPGKFEKHTDYPVACLAESRGWPAASMLIIGLFATTISGFFLWRTMDSAPGA